MATMKLANGYDIEVPTKSRNELLLKARGFISENFNIAFGNGTGGSLTGGTIFAVAVGVKEGDVITNTHVAVKTAGTASGQTLFQTALLDSAGNRLAVSADSAADRTAAESTGIKTIALATAYTVPKDCQAVYVAVVSTNGTTNPSVLVSGTTDVIAASSLTGKFKSACTAGTSQSAIGTSETIATTGTINFWAALS